MLNDILRTLNPVNNFISPGVRPKILGVTKFIAGMTLLSLFFRSTETLVGFFVNYLIKPKLSEDFTKTEKKCVEATQPFFPEITDLKKSC